MKYQLRMGAEAGQEMGELNYQSIFIVVNECLTRSTVDSLSKRLLSVWYDANKYPHRSSIYAARVTANVADRFSAFLYGFRTKVRRLVQKHCEEFEATFKTGLKPVDAFL